jgi:hypothetical protein
VWINTAGWAGLRISAEFFGPSRAESAEVACV